MAQLRKFEFNEGTMDEPIVLSQNHVNALISLWTDENVEKSINGVVYKETLYDSERDALEAMGFTVLVGAQLEDQFSISPALEYINEGESTTIEADGINAAALKFEIMEIKITYDEDNLGEDYIKSKIGFNFNVLKVASAKENSSWIAEVTFKAYPSAHPINYRTGKVTVNAVGINNVVIQGESMLNEGDTAIYTGQVLPENNTKTFSKIVFSAKYGHFGDNLYSAPTGYTSDVITATVSAYNRAYSGTKSIVIGAVVLNNTNKNAVVFNAVKAGLKSAGWTTLGSQPIDSATEMTSIDAYRVTSSDFKKILLNLKNISVDYSFDEGEYFVNVTSIDVNGDNDNFGPNLTSINMSNLNTISYSVQGEKGLFKNCTKLSNVVLNGLTTINRQNVSTTETEQTFYNCTSLVTINLPNLNSIEGIYKQGNFSTFENCSNLKNVYLPKLNTIRNIGNSYERKIRIFANCKSLEFIELPNLVSINGINNMFDGCENLIAASFPKLTDIVDTSTVFAGMFNNCSKLRSVNFSCLINLSNRQLFANTTIKNYVGNNEFGFDESIDGGDKVLDWSKIKLVNLDNVNSMFKNTNLFKYVLPSTLNKLTGFNILSDSKIGIVDLRKCRNVNTVDAVFNDTRNYLQLYKLHFLRFSSSTPPSITDAVDVTTGKRTTLGPDAPIFCPTSYFNNYKNDTILNNLFYSANSHNKIKILEYMKFSCNNVGSFNTISLSIINSKIELITESQNSHYNAPVFIIGDSNNGIEFNRYNINFLVDGSVVWSGSGKYKFIIENNNNETTKISIYDINDSLLFENNYIFSNNIIKFDKQKGHLIFGILYSIKRYINSELVNNIVPAFDVNNIPCLYDTVSNILHRPNNMDISIYGTVQNIITVETNYSGTYDEIRNAYEQYLVDGTTECPWERGVSVNRLFPDEMMDWMCKSIFGFNKSWSGDLEDIPVELL